MQKIHSSKKYLAAIAICTCMSLFAFAQTQEAYEMTIDGVKVVVKPSGNEIVEIQTIFKGGVQNYAADKAGIETIAMDGLTECGTTKDDKNSFKNKLDKVSAQVYANTGKDYSTFTMNCIKSDFETVWPLYVDAMTTPLFDKKEFDRIKQDAINNLKANASQPDYAINKMAKEVVFAGKDYAKNPEGTEATVSALTADEAKAYYQSILTRSRLLMVVVGEIDRSTLEQKIKSLLDAIPAGNPVKLKREMYSPKQNSFKSEKKELATNYIQGVTSAPVPGASDFDAFTLASRIFYDRQFLEVRSNNGLSYAPYTFADNGLTNSFNMVVSTTQPDKYIAVMDKLIEKTRKEGFTADEVKDIKTSYLTRFYRNLETNDAQAGSFAANEVLFNKWQRALTIKTDIKKVSLGDVNNAFNKYVNNITWVYQGDPTKATVALFAAPIQSKEKLPDSKLSGEKKN